MRKSRVWNRVTFLPRGRHRSDVQNRMTWRATLAMACLLASVAARAQPPAVDAYVGLKSASDLGWSPDGRYVAYELTASSGAEIRVSDVQTGATRIVARGLPHDRQAFDQADVRWSVDAGRVVYRARSSYYTVPATGGTPTLLFGDTTAKEVVQLSPDQSQVSFIRAGELWVQPVGGGTARRLTTGEQFLSQPTQFAFRLGFWPPWSPDGRKIAYNGARGQVGIVDIASGTTTWIQRDSGAARAAAGFMTWSPDSRRLAISRMAMDFRKKTLSVADAATGREAPPIWADTHPKWVTQNNHKMLDMAWSPDGRQVALLSIRSGWHRPYVIDANGASHNTAAPLTQGAFETWWVQWLPSGRGLVAVTNQDNVQQSLPWRIDLDGRSAVPLTAGPGVAWSEATLNIIQWPAAVLSPDGSRVAFAFSTPDDFAQVRVAETDVAAGSQRSRTLYSTVADGFPQSALGLIEAVRFPGADGASVPAVIITPRTLSPNKRHAALLFMYGGWGQMASLGRSLPGKGQLFDFLASRGIVTLVVDPRGSDGYGNDWAHGMWHDVAGKQADDLIAGAGYLRTLPYIDPNAVVIFGHSFSGYLAMATLIKDTSAFNAGVLQGSVSDFAFSRNTTYGRIRFGGEDGSPSLMESRGRPSRHVDRITVPLLVTHGTKDFNVPLAMHDTLVKHLFAARKQFEVIVYPDQPHHWESADIVHDWLARVERFIRHVQADNAASRR